ncbi:MAG TPA: hypothetical protein VEQ38_18220 [Verrucomicrobiae bacterium]|nr:hypothetical protein [Verrucomicrobiae bacterium]
MKSLLGEIITWPKKMSMTALIAITVTNEEKAEASGAKSRHAGAVKISACRTVSAVEWTKP